MLSTLMVFLFSDYFVVDKRDKMKKTNASGAIYYYKLNYFCLKTTLLHSIAEIFQVLTLQRELIKKGTFWLRFCRKLWGKFLLLLASRFLSQVSFCTPFCQETMCHLCDSHCKHPAQGRECLGVQGSVSSGMNLKKKEESCKVQFCMWKWIWFSIFQVSFS